ncbi:MAG TPA: glycosyltransferase family 4 protein [Thermoanaerobaculia bacterium]|jgi:glycosyltransferase involved in cell wall biosynthesis|nr:glycosyltransferase family 4 protein [Thermoanaerobaculia bacterium]
MRIFQILEFNQFNTGSVHQMFQAASGLRERGHEVTIVSRPDPVLEEKARGAGVAFAGLPMRSGFDLISAWKLGRKFREARPDVVHVHKGVAHSLALAATFMQPVGAFVVNRGVSFPLDTWNRIKYRTCRVDRVVTVCEQIKEVIVASGRLPREKVEVVYAGTDVTHFDPEKWDARAFRREKGIADDRFLIAQVGVRDWKGWKELIDALASILPSHPRAHLALIGCRHERERGEVDAYSRERGIAENVTPVEYRDDMPNVFASCDLVVDASWAGTGITGTVREAMAMRKPVIATDCGGNRELVSSPEVGWLIPAKEVPALALAIAEVIDDEPRRARVAANAREHVVRGFSKELRITKLEKLYGEICNARRGTAATPR